MVAINIFSACRAGMRGMMCSQLRMAIVAASATILSALATPSGAGITPSDDSSDPLKAAAAYYSYISEHAPGMVDALVNYSEQNSKPAKCDRNEKPRVGAVLIGATEAGAPFSKLSGPDNDVQLIYDSLIARGVDDNHIWYLDGNDAGRDNLAAAFTEVIEEVNCGDHVLFYFSGNASRAEDMIGALLPQDLLDQFQNVDISDIWGADLYAPDDEATAAMRWARRGGLYLALDQQQEGVLDLVSASDISDFVTNLRNRQVDVTVALDTSYADQADIAGRQARVGDSTIWSVETTGDGNFDAEQEYIALTQLLPTHGNFAAFYASAGDSHAREFGFDNGDGTETVYGAFTFRLANVIQNRDTVTVRALTDSLKMLPQDAEGRTQRYRIEANDPEMAMFADRPAAALPATEAIVITKPAATRGAAAVEKAEVEIEGSVSWSAPAKAVLVDGKSASLKPDGTFRHKATLKAGANAIEIVALTADGRTHEKLLEFVFEGDKKALEGEGARYAVIIANQDYDRAKSGFDSLTTPFADADAVAALLTTKYGFRTEAKLPDGSTANLLLKNATRRDIETVLYKIGLVAGEKDTVLIYYAGHGIYEEKTTIAFWVPSDAEAGVPISYLSASTIAEAVQRMQANKVIIVSDSCFSGALLRGGGDQAPKISDADRERALLALTQRRSRVLISSGSNEPVLDRGGKGHSIFARALITGLEDMPHASFSARELYDGYLLPLVVANADQEPQYRPIERSGHDGGDVIFVKQSN
jgi:hypothetical protein